MKGRGRARSNWSSPPLQGRGTKGPNWGAGEGVRVLVYDVPEKPSDANWPSEVADSSLHTIHNLQLIDLNGDGRDEIVLAAWEGVFVLERDIAGHWTRTRVGSGNQESKPSKGSSEVKVGRLQGGGSYIATIEPWHGFQVVVYTPPAATADRGATRPRRPRSGRARSSPSRCSGATPSGAPTSTATATRS